MITMLNRQMCANEHDLTSESKLTSSHSAEEVIWGFQAQMVFQTGPWDITSAQSTFSQIVSSAGKRVYIVT